MRGHGLAASSRGPGVACLDARTKLVDTNIFYVDTNIFGCVSTFTGDDGGWWRGQRVQSVDIAAVAELAVVARLLGAGRGQGVETVGYLHHTNSCTLLTLALTLTPLAATLFGLEASVVCAELQFSRDVNKSYL